MQPDSSMLDPTNTTAKGDEGKQPANLNILPQRRKRRLLAPRQAELLLLMKDGFSDKDIAERMQISDLSVKSMMTGIFNKLRLRKRAQVASWALEHVDELKEISQKSKPTRSPLRLSATESEQNGLPERKERLQPNPARGDLLGKLEQLYNDASQKPWGAWADEGDRYSICSGELGLGPHECVATAPYRTPKWKANRDLIVAMHAHLPLLIRIARELQALKRQSDNCGTEGDLSEEARAVLAELDAAEVSNGQ